MSRLSDHDLLPDDIEPFVDDSGDKADAHMDKCEELVLRVGRLTTEGTVEAIGKMTLAHGVGIDVRSDDGVLMSIAIAKDDLSQLAPLLFKRVRISVEEVQ